MGDFSLLEMKALGSHISVFIICDSPKKSSTAQKVYKRLRGQGPSLYNLSVSLRSTAPLVGGASGETVHFAGTAKASPTRRGGIASAMTERLYEGEPDLFHAKRPLHFCSGLFSENQAG